MPLPKRKTGLWSYLWRPKRQIFQPEFGRCDTSSLSALASDSEITGDDEELLEKDMASMQPVVYQRRSQVSSFCLVFLTTLISVICSVAFVLVLSDHFSKQTSPQPSIGQPDLTAPFRPTLRLRHCGTSPGEARSLGCKFQIWSYSWVPPECYDEELVQDWLAIRDWEYFDDRYTRGKVVNFTTEVLPGERHLFSTWGQHYWHCAFTWRKFLRAALGSGVGITDQDLDYHHANHCQDTIRNKPDYRPWDENDIELTLGFHSC